MPDSATVTVRTLPMPCGVMAILRVDGSTLVLLNEARPAAWPAALTEAVESGLLEDYPC